VASKKDLTPEQQQEAAKQQRDKHNAKQREYGAKQPKKQAGPGHPVKKGKDTT
jgi:hypothetical protein